MGPPDGGGGPQPKIKDKTVEDLALFLLNYGAAYSEALREVDVVRAQVRALKAERKVVRDFFRGDDA